MHLKIVQKPCKYLFQVKKICLQCPTWVLQKQKKSSTDLATVQSSGD